MATSVIQDKEANIIGAPFAVEQQIDPFRKARLTQVFISRDPKDKEVYEQSKALALTKVGLEKLAIGASMTFRTEKIISSQHYAQVIVEGFWTNASGETVSDKKTAELDLEVTKSEIFSKPIKVWDSAQRKMVTISSPTEFQKKEDEEKKMAEYNQIRKFKIPLCESKAKNRVIRSLLGIKNVYTAEELAKPFVFPVVSFSPDFTDPEIKHAVIQKFLGNNDALFGARVPNVGVIETPAPEISSLSEGLEKEYSEIVEDFGDEAQYETPEIVEEETPAPVQPVKEEVRNTSPYGTENPVCATCGSSTTFRSGTNPETKKYWEAYFCDAKCGAKPNFQIVKTPPQEEVLFDNPDF
ncbi:MAG: hypothetical protein WCJ84_00545 [Candidatus Peregrinibacteria bacterium]